MGLYIADEAEGILFFPSSPVLPSCALAAGHHCPCPGVLLALRIRGVSVDPLQGGLLLPDFFPWMPVMPLCPPFFVLGFVPRFLGHYLTFRVYCLNYWVEEIYLPPV